MRKSAGNKIKKEDKLREEEIRGFMKKYQILNREQIRSTLVAFDKFTKHKLRTKRTHG